MAGSRSLGALTLDIVAKTGGFEQGMDRAARTADRRMQEISRKAKIAGAAIAAGLAAAGAATAVALRRTIDEADATSKMAQRIGITAEALSRLDYAAKLSDVSLQDLGNSVKRLGQFQVEAIKGGNEQATILDRLGISASDAATGGLKDAESMLQELAAVFQTLPDGADKTALAVKLFGRSGAELIPLLNLGADGLQKFAEKADRAGYTLDTNTTLAAATFNDTFGEMRLSVDGMWRSTLPSLLPKLQDFANMIDSTQFRDGFATIINGAVGAVGALAKFATTTANVTKFLGEEVAARLHGPALDDTVRVNEELKRIDDRIQRLQQGGAFFTNPDPAFVRDAQQRRGVLGSIFAGTAEEELEFLEGHRAKLQGALKDFEGLQAQAKKIADDAASPVDLSGLGLGERPTTGGGSARPGASTMPDFTRGAADELRRLMDAEHESRKQFEAMAATLSGPVAEANYRYAEELRSLQEAARAGAIDTEALAAAQAKLAEQHEANVAAIERQLNPGRELLKDLEFELHLMELGNAERTTAIQLRGMDSESVKRYGAAIADANRMIEESMERTRALDGVRREFEGFFTDVLRGNESITSSFRNMLEGISNMISQRIAEGWVDQLFGQPGQSGGGWFGSVMGAFSGTAGGSGGESAGSLFDLFSDGGFWSWGGGRNTGGPVSAGHLYRVNETGIEAARIPGREDYLLMGNQSGTVVPANAVGSKVGPQTINFNVQGKMDRRSRDQIAMDMRMQQMVAARNQ